MAGNKDLRIIQITDSHLRKEPEGVLLGMNTRDSLDAVLELIRNRQETPDLVLATGDLAQDGSAEAYRCFAQKMSMFSCPVVWFSGNHDDPEVMAKTVEDRDAFTKVKKMGSWKFIFLDSSVREKVHGELSEEDLDLLARELARDQDLHVAVCFHHHPVTVNSKWIDTIGLKNRESLFAILDRYSHVRLILWGHIHQEFDQVRNNVRLLATPSTCVQFKPLSREFAVDDQAPGYRWLRLDSEGGVETAVVRADHIDFVVDLSSKGY